MISPATPASHSVVARLHFSKGYTTRHKVCHANLPKAVHHLAPARAAAREAFGREGLSSWHHTMHSLLANGMRKSDGPALPRRRACAARAVCGGLVHIV
jgi:hypothetical protein